jgi:short-subunit dehydrogenase
VGSFEEITIEEAKHLFETNFFGALCMSEAVLPILRRQGYGRIINIGSAAGFTATPYQAIYSASKHAISFSESLDREVRQFGIRASVIEPGFTGTHIGQNAPIARTLVAGLRERSRSRDQCHPQNNTNGKDPDDAARVVLKALASCSPRLVYLAGSDARLVSGLRKFAPSGLFDKGLQKQLGLAGGRLLLKALEEGCLPVVLRSGGRSAPK